MKKGDIRKDSLFTPEEGVIPPGDTAPPYEDLLGYVWKRVWSWFRGTAEGGIYETLVDVTHYARGWWTWHIVSDPSQIKDGLPGWASRVYDYFQNWPGHAHEWFEDKVGRLEWAFRPTGAGGIWQHLSDTFDRFKNSFAQFRDNPTAFINDRLPQWIKDLWHLWKNAWKWMYDRFQQWFKDAVSLVNTWKTEISHFFTNLYTTIKDFLSHVWTWLWEHFQQWFKDAVELVHEWRARINNFFANLYTTIVDFLSRVWKWIYEHVPQTFKDIWSNASTWWDWLKNRWDDFTREIGAFIHDPFKYLTGKLQAWIEGWRDYIFGVVGDLLEQLIREVALYLLDWIGYIAPSLEDIDEMGPHFSSFTDMLEEWARAWRELKEAWVKEAMAMMEGFAAELRGEEVMELLTPSETIMQYWQMLTPDQIRLLVEPPIKG